MVSTTIIRDAEEYENIKHYLLSGQTPSFARDHQRKTFIEKAQKFILINNKLWTKNKKGNNVAIILPNNHDEIDDILDSIHLPNHTGMLLYYYRSKCYVV